MDNNNYSHEYNTSSNSCGILLSITHC